MLLNIGLNIALPALILTFGGSWFGWPPWVVLVVGLIGPLGYGGWELVAKKKVNHISLLGLISVLATGGIGLLQLDAGWVAVKEAALPLLLGAFVLVSAFTARPVVRTFLFDAEILDTERIDAAIAERGTQAELASLLKTSTLWVAASFVLSAVLNYGLAAYLVRSPSGSEAFNAELGQLTVWSLPVIVVPSMAITLAVMAWLLKGLQRVSGLDLDALTGNEADEE